MQRILNNKVWKLFQGFFYVIGFHVSRIQTIFLSAYEREAITNYSLFCIFIRKRTKQW